MLKKIPIPTEDGELSEGRINLRSPSREKMSYNRTKLRFTLPQWNPGKKQMLQFIGINHRFLNGSP